MYQQPLTYHPSMRRGGFQPVVAPMYMSRYMAQAPQPQGETTAPIPAPVPPPPKKMSAPATLAIGAGGGAITGYLLTLLLPKVIKKFPKGPDTRTAGIVGGVIGGLTGTGIALLLRD